MARTSSSSAPLCPHFPACGGCRLQDLDAASYEKRKIGRLRELLVKNGLDESVLLPPVVTAPETRRRARLAAKRLKGKTLLGFNAWRSHEIVNLESCRVLLPELTRFILALRDKLPLWLPERGEADIQITLLPEGLDVVMIGGPPLDLAAREALAELAGTLDIAHLSWRKWDRSPIEPVAHRKPLGVTFGTTRLPFPPASFLQATETGEKALIAFAREAVGDAEKILDLFSGLGTFGLSMGKAKKVSFVDLDSPAMQTLALLARQNPRFSAEERNLAKEPLAAADCGAYDAVIFDPPRGGAKAQAAELARSAVQNVVAVSCDPPTFARDAKILIAGGYELKSLLPVDQFLWSEHLELAGHFMKQSSY